LAIEPTESYAKGDWVEVVVGPLLGLKGTLVNIQGKDKMLVELVNSGYTLQISIDRNLLNKVEA
jgi:ribosomal protein L24